MALLNLAEVTAAQESFAVAADFAENALTVAYANDLNSHIGRILQAQGYALYRVGIPHRVSQLLACRLIVEPFEADVDKSPGGCGLAELREHAPRLLQELRVVERA